MQENLQAVMTLSWTSLCYSPSHLLLTNVSVVETAAPLPPCITLLTYFLTYLITFSKRHWE